MGKGGGSAPAPSSQTVNQTNLPAWAQPYSENILGKAEALTDTSKNPYTPYTGQRVADFTPMQQQAFQGLQGMQPNAATGAGIDVAANVARQAGQYGNYQPQQFGNQYQGQNFNNMGLGYLATQNPNLQSFQMQGPQNVRGAQTQAAQLNNAPTYGGTQFQGPQDVRGAQTQAAQLNAAPIYGGTQFQGPQNVAAERVGTQNFNDPATAQSYMNPYTQNVVNIQQREAQRNADIAATTANAQASRAGAFGGSAQAILKAEAARNLATQKGDIQAQGLNSAYNQAQQAFQTDQARQLQAQQANQQTGLQAGMSNQQMGYNTNLQNAQLGQQAGLATQGLMGQYGLQQGQFNQAANLANQQTRQQADLANQQMGYNTNLQNAQLGQQAGLANQQMAGQYGLQQGQFNQAANLANQQTRQQANLANQQMGYNVGNTNLQAQLGVQQLGSGQNMQSQLANQGAYGQMQGLGMQQNLAGNQQAIQNAQLAAQYGLAGQQGSEQSRQFGSNLGLQGLQQQLAAAGQLGQLGQQQYGQQMGIASAQQQAGAQQQAMNQQNLTNTYQDYLTKQNYPYQQLGFMSDILHGTPTGGVTTQQSYQANPSMANQIMGYGLGAYGLSNLLGKKEGGVIKGYKEGGVVKHFAEGGITGLPGAMPLEAQYQLALKMGVGPLQGILNGKPSQITPVVAASALKQLQSAQVAANGMQAQQELAKNPGTVLDRMKAQQQPAPLPEDQGGIAALNTDNMNDVVQAAEGGIIGYADGGDVVGMADGVPRSWRDYWNGSPANKDLFDVLSYDPKQWATSPAGKPIPQVLGLSPRAPRADDPTAMAPTPAQMQANQGPYDVGLPASAAAAAAPAATSAPRNNAPRTAAAPKGGVSDLVAPQVRDMFSVIPQKTGASSASQGVATVAPPSFADTLSNAAMAAGKAAEYTQPEMDALNKLVESRRGKIETERGERKSTAVNLGAVFAAGELLQSGRSDISSLGEAMKVIGKQGVEFNKDEQRIKDKLDEGDLALAQAKLTFKKGNYESGLKLLDSFTQNSNAAAKIAGDKAYHDAVIELQREGRTLDQAKFEAEKARHAAEQPFINNLRIAQANAFNSAAQNKGGMTPALREKAADNVRSMLSKPAQREALKQRPEFKGMTDTEIESALFTQEFAKITGGLGGLGSLAGAGAFQNPAFGEGAAPQGATIRPLVPAKS